MEALILKSELADLANCPRPTVSKHVKTRLKPALTSDGKKLFLNHPAVQSFIAEHRRRRAPQRVTAAPDPSPGPTLPPDPFAAARASAAPQTVLPLPSAAALPVLPKPSQESAGPGAAAPLVWNADREAAAYIAAINHELPAPITDLGSWTLREIVDRYGGLPGLRDATRSLRDFAEMQNKEAITAKRRGEVIDRAVISGVLVPLIDLAFSRLVSEAPAALAGQVIARVNSGGGDLLTDVEEIIRDENSGILQDCRDKVLSEIDSIESATMRGPK